MLLTATHATRTNKKEVLDTAQTRFKRLWIIIVDMPKRDPPILKGCFVRGVG
jgi:hypothetical protein